MKRIVITGSNGFVGKNLKVALRAEGNVDLILVDRNTDLAAMEPIKVDAVFHLAGINRPEEGESFESGNVEYTQQVMKCFRPTDLSSKFVFSSSAKAATDTEYGLSKQKAEKVVSVGAEEYGWTPIILRLPNLFGKWCRPYYNSVVATFIAQAFKNEPFSIHNENMPIDLMYIDDLVVLFLKILRGDFSSDFKFDAMPYPTYETTIGELADSIKQIAETHATPWLIPIENELLQRLHVVYLSALDRKACQFRPFSISSDTGTFRELFKSPDFGQVSVLVIEPEATRGNHFHHTKCECFHLVSSEVLLTEVDMSTNVSTKTLVKEGSSFWTRPGVAHTIKNVGNEAATLVIWANEVFDPERPDTFKETPN